jgi:hypothetical protein
LKIEIQCPKGCFLVGAIVRHAKRVLPHMVPVDRPGMGVEFIDPPQELLDFLTSL